MLGYTVLDFLLLLNRESLFITLLDLKTAFGEVYHNLIQEILSYHYVAEHIKCLVRDLCTDLKTSIITHDLSTPIHYKRLWSPSKLLPKFSPLEYLYPTH